MPGQQRKPALPMSLPTHLAAAKDTCQQALALVLLLLSGSVCLGAALLGRMLGIVSSLLGAALDVSGCMDKQQGQVTMVSTELEDAEAHVE